MERRHDARDDAVHAHEQAAGGVARDHCWAGNLRSAVQCSAVLLAVLLVIDWGNDSLTTGRCGLWAGLAALLFVLLFPPRVTAGKGWLSSRGLLPGRRVRTDLLVSVRCLDGVSQRLRLRDALGGRVEIDPQVLVNNPGLWHRLAEDARESVARGSLTCGETVLRRLSERIDRQTARSVFKVSELD
ncbi:MULTISPECIES: hypothetical protein [Streptomyces]|uniref:hypothetical protein n=1 Tax=Streptomyces TaxID=1883 RepID=UPI002035C561|nr:MULTISPECIES: hypothetical protein [Streptomyces]UUA04074.1 hypothetical protein NNW98_00455 [Streptomyces koelreuteriae]UUA11700.1 hypothetical protein NNW99_00455 [Streptomyces sp. CRCS-T-1]